MRPATSARLLACLLTAVLLSALSLIALPSAAEAAPGGTARADLAARRPPPADPGDHRPPRRLPHRPHAARQRPRTRCGLRGAGPPRRRHARAAGPPHRRGAEGFIGVPGRTAVRGSGARSELSLIGTSDFNALFRFSDGDNVLEDVRLSRGRAASGFMLVFPHGSGYWMAGVRIDGRAARFGGGFSALDLGPMAGETVSRLTMVDTTVTGVDYGVHQSSRSSGLVTDVEVRDSTFTGNFATDLEFNAPAGSGTNVTVLGNVFSDNRSTGFMAYSEKRFWPIQASW